MLKSKKTRLMTILATSAVSLAVAGPASAANQNGLVNVDLSDNTVQVPVGIAANICGVTANVIASDNFTGSSTCESTSRPSAQGGGGNGGGGSNQRGLVNVALVGNTVQLPIGVAANVCGVTVNLIAAGNVTGSSTCDAVSRPTADA